MKHRIYYIASSCIIFEKCLCPPLLFEICFITSRPDKTLLPVDISHRISSSQLKELVRSVICQQVLRLCQTQQHKRQPSKKKKKKQRDKTVGGGGADGKGKHHLRQSRPPSRFRTRRSLLSWSAPEAVR